MHQWSSSSETEGTDSSSSSGSTEESESESETDSDSMASTDEEDLGKDNLALAKTLLILGLSLGSRISWLESDIIINRIQTKPAT